MQSIFSPWIHKISVGGNNSKLNKVVYDKVEAYLDDSRFDSDFWNCNVWTSFKNKNLFEKEERILDQMVSEPVKQVIQKLNYSTKNLKMRSWLNAYKEFQWQEFHNHLPSLLSGVYFVSFDEENHGKLSFKNPIPQWRCSLVANPDIDLNKTNDLLYKEEFVPQVKESDLIIFPSGLDHGVKLTKKKSNKLRITYSFNVMCKE